MRRLTRLVLVLTVLVADGGLCLVAGAVSLVGSWLFVRMPGLNVSWQGADRVVFGTVPDRRRHVRGMSSCAGNGSGNVKHDVSEQRACREFCRDVRETFLPQLDTHTGMIVE